MDYKNIRNKTLKFYKGGVIPKLAGGDMLQLDKKKTAILLFRQNHANELTGSENDDIIWNMLMSLQIDNNGASDGRVNAADFTQSVLDENSVTLEQANAKVAELKERGVIAQPNLTSTTTLTSTTKTSNAPQLVGGANAMALGQNIGNFANNMDQMTSVGADGKKHLTSEGKAAIGGMAAQAGVMAMSAVDNALMGDKNFGALSAAVDSLVHGTSKALMSSGNPYCVCKGTRVITASGEFKNIEDIAYADGIIGYASHKAVAEDITYIFPTIFKECVEIETTKGNRIRCSIDHPILSATSERTSAKTINGKRIRLKNYTFKEAGQLQVDDYVAEIGSVPFFGNTRIKDAYLIGMLIGDGTYRKRSVPILTTTDPDTWKYLEENKLGILGRIEFTCTNKEVRYYRFNQYLSYLRELGIFGLVGTEKRLPINLHMWDKQSCAELIAGLIDTDGYVMDTDPKHCGIFFTQANFALMYQLKELLLKFGIHCTIITSQSEDHKFFNGKTYKCKEGYVLAIKSKESVINFYNNITLNISYKQDRLRNCYNIKIARNTKDQSYTYLGLVADKIRRITPLGICQVYNLQVSGSHTFIAENIITHNCMIAGAALEGANFLTKAGGDTVQGFDVDINNSGYGTLGHMESKSSRDWGAALGLGGLFGNKNTAEKLAKRNEQARMALTAAEISADQSFEQEARMNNVENTIMNNQIALAGGLETSLLAG